QTLEGVVDRPERVVESVHEHPAHHLDHGDSLSRCRVVHAGAHPWRACRVVGGAHQPGGLLHQFQSVRLIEPVVAERHDVGSRGAQLLEMAAREPEASSGVLAVDDDEVVVGAFAFEESDGCRHARGAEDVADEEQTHAATIAANRGRAAPLGQPPGRLAAHAKFTLATWTSTRWTAGAATYSGKAAAPAMPASPSLSASRRQPSASASPNWNRQA